MSTSDITRVIRELVTRLDVNPNREGLQETPERAAKAWEYWTSGYDVDPASVLKTFDDGSESYDAMVFQGNIACFSTCEHHLAPFFGVAHIGYIPGSRIVGLSKLARLVEVFSRRLQVQERITSQVANALEKHLDPKGVGVVLQCRHMCMESRGIQKIGTVTTTSCLHGAIRDEPETRAEFMTMVTSTQQVTIL